MVITSSSSAADRLPRRGPLAVSLPLLFMMAVAVIGCDDGRPDVPFGTVKGRVTWRGEPLADALVVFQPEKGRPSSGRTSQSGEYELRYKERPWGAIVGRHRVQITTSRGRLDDQTATGGGIREELSPEILPTRFHSASTLTAEVAKGANRIDFDLQDK